MKLLAFAPKNLTFRSSILMLFVPFPQPLPHLQPLSALTVKGYANNEIRVTHRSRLWGQNEYRSPQSGEARSNRLAVGKDARTGKNKIYQDNSRRKVQDKIDRFRAFLMWLGEVERGGYHRCPVPGIFQYLPVNARYDGQKVSSDRLIFMSYPDGTLEGWDIKSGTQIIDLNIKDARTRIKSLLDITSELQVTPKSRAKIGQDNRQTAFTSRARHTLLEAGEVVHRACPSFSPDAAANARAVTLTLPGSTPEALRALASYSSWLINNLNQLIRDTELPIQYFYVAELQKRGALHWHYCIAANPLEVTMNQLELLGNQLINRWFELLKLMASKRKVKRGGKEGNLPGIDMFQRSESAINTKNSHIKSWREFPEKWQSDNKAIEKNVASYFSKYASKNASSSFKGKINNFYCPARWWGCNSAIRKMINEWRFQYTVYYSPEQGTTDELIQDVLQQFNPICSYSRSFQKAFKMPDGSDSGHFACNGVLNIMYFNRDEYREVWELFKELKPVFQSVGFYRSISPDKIKTVLLSDVVFKHKQRISNELIELTIRKVNDDYLICKAVYNNQFGYWQDKEILSQFDTYDDSIKFIKYLISEGIENIEFCAIMNKEDLLKNYDYCTV